jgi:hypothetical protein
MERGGLSSYASHSRVYARNFEVSGGERLQIAGSRISNTRTLTPAPKEVIACGAKRLHRFWQ